MKCKSTNMDSSKLTAFLFIFMLSLSTIPQTLACDYCPKSPPKSPKSSATPNPVASTPPVKLPPIGLPKLPPVGLPPVGLPKLPPVGLPKLPPVGLPKLPPVGLPKLPPVGLPKLPPVGLPKLPPVGLPKLPPVGLPPILGNGGSPASPPTSSCPSPPAAKESCPIDALKLGACVNLLGNTVQIGDAAVECCPVVDGLVGVAAAACLCTAIKANLLDIGVYLPIALQVLVACGSSVPSGYTCA
ncbi:hypothetical protein LUZ61_008421 [Rhynchospora tenuis]|uniref:Bifunctional inhibitor/plant lipid transfer protein/seed storage helical domain-containing protein n=1 Tax=Rhynchospora tenuis TaxID=198213 RepID=A0AAD5ZVD8_9POAL|nr:hypothetical protein LUZ61_008421 [Rhynchospora tenuis]